MSEAYIGEIRMFGGKFAPVGWAFCNGQILSIAENEILYTLIGTTYGGDGQTTFALPDLQGRIPVGLGDNYLLGQKGGVESVTLVTGELPAHNHVLQATTEAGDSAVPTNAIWAQSAYDQYAAGTLNATMKAGLVGGTGGNQPHDNMMPSLAISFIIALEGIYPQPD